MKITRLPISDRMATEVIKLKPTKGNITTLNKLHHIITGEDASDMQVRTKRQFKDLRDVVVDAYLTKVSETKAQMLKRPTRIGAARFALSNMRWMISKELGVDYSKCAN